MIRPPRPLLKHRGIEHQCVSANPNKSSKPVNHLTDMLITRFSSASLQNQKPNQLALKKTEDSETNLQDKFVTVFISPRLPGADQTLKTSSRNTVGLKSGGFKIRYLSSQARKTSRGHAQTTEINCHNRGNSVMETSNFDKTAIVKAQLYQHPFEKNIRLITCKTAISKFQTSEFAQNKTCLVIPDSLFQQSISEVGNQELLSQLGSILTAKSIGLALQVSSSRNISWVKQAGSDLNSLCFAIWSNQKQASSTTVLNLQKLKDNFTNYIIITDASAFGTTAYSAGTGARYVYLQISNIKDVTKLASSLCLISSDQFNINSAQFSYYETSKIVNITQAIMDSKLIIEKINMAKSNIQLQQTRPRSLSLKEMSGNEGEAQKKFKQDYRNKLVQLAKLLSIEQQKRNFNPLNNSHRYPSNRSRYLDISIGSTVTSLMECIVPTSTSYQLANDLIRNNQLNWQQIAKFIEKTKLK